MRVHVPTAGPLVTALFGIALLGSIGCDPASPDPSTETDLELDSDGADPLDALAPPQTAEAAGKRLARPDSLAADRRPVAVTGWTAAVSEETPPATCAGKAAVTGGDCMGGHCDDVQLFCSNTSGTPGNRTWTSWFSEEGSSWRICPGTEWMTGVACRGSWCDDISIECTDLGLTAKSCMWSRGFGSTDPIFDAPTGHLVAGVQCLGAYCDKLSYFHCEV